MKVAIQGGPASFHHIAAKKYFNQEVEILDSPTFDGVCKMLQNDEAEFGLMAIENSIAATILLNYDLIRTYKLKIVGEEKIRIRQNMMALPGQKITDIKKVMSHYMALVQCNDFLNDHPHIEQEKFFDTADAAKEIKEKKLTGVAAIASDLAAELYGLEIIAPEIETIKENYTRFYVLSKDRKGDPHNRSIDKATICFTLPDEVGSLAKALQIVVDHQINLTKIQSIPVIGEPDNYRFYLDCMWNEYANIVECLNKLRHVIENFEILGEYKNCPLPSDS